MKLNNSPQHTPDANKPDNKLDAYWGTLRETDHAESFAKTSAWVHRRQSAAEGNAWSRLLHGAKFRVAAAVLAVIFVVGACNYPVDVKEPVAAVLRWDVKADDKAAQEALNRLSWMEQEQMLVEKKNINGVNYLTYSVTLTDIEPQVLKSYKTSLADIPGVTELTALPVSHTRSQPLYAAALQGLFKIEMDATGISNEDLEKELNAQLQQQGIKNLAIVVKTGPNGERQIKTKPTDGQIEDYGLDLTVKDGRRVTRIKEQVKHGEGNAEKLDVKNMSDDEIKAFILKEHVRQNLSPEDITIVREPGKVEVKVDSKGSKMNLMFKDKN
jgi:hypothetical protein